MSPTMEGDCALPEVVPSRKDPNSDDTSDDDDAPSCQRVSASRVATRDESRDSRKVSRPSSCQFSRQGGVDVSRVKFQGIT